MFLKGAFYFFKIPIFAAIYLFAVGFLALTIGLFLVMEDRLRVYYVSTTDGIVWEAVDTLKDGALLDLRLAVEVMMFLGAMETG